MSNLNLKEGLLDLKGMKTGFSLGKVELIGLAASLVLFSVLNVVTFEGLSPAGHKALSLLVLILALWMNPGIPQTFSSFLLIVLTVGMGVMKLPDFLSSMGTSPMFMVFALVVVAMGMTNTSLSQRVAYFLIARLGTSPTKLVLAMIIATTVVSMFIADIPTLVMMMYIGVGILNEMKEVPGKSRTGKAMMFGMMAASITGGLAFISGSGINPVGIAVLEKATKGAMTITYGQWAAVGLPFAIIMILPMWLILHYYFRLDKIDEDTVQLDKAVFVQRAKDLGAVSNTEWRYIISITIMMVLFVTSMWTNLSVPFISFIAFLLVIAPGWGVVNWKEAQKKVPWDLIFMVGTGTAFAYAISATGLGLWIIKALMGWATGLSALPLILVTAAVGVFCHYVILVSPSAVAVLVAAVIPLAEMAHINPALLVLPVIFTGSSTIIMPLAPDMLLTYPFGYWKISELFLPGFLIALVWILVAGLCTYFIAPLVGLI